MRKRKCLIKDIAYLDNNYFNYDGVDFINYLDTGSITENVISGIQHLDTRTNIIPSRAKKTVKENTIIYSAVRPSHRHYGIILNPLKNMVVSTGFITIDLKKEIDPYYFYYNLTQKIYTEHLMTIATNSVSSYPSIVSEDLGNLKIDIFIDNKIQKRISNLLLAIDKKIELNKKINATLEKMAKDLYNYWFVQFDFPDGNKRPLYLSKFLWG